MITIDKSPTQLAGLQIVFPRAGSIYENKEERGLSHLLEHMICRPLRPIEQTLQRYGISYNAHTNTNYVMVYFSGLDEYLAPRAQELVNLIVNYQPNQADLDIERKIVLQEIGDGLANKDRVFWQNVIATTLHRHPVIGYKHDIEHTTLQKCTDAFHKFYSEKRIRYCGPEAIHLTSVPTGSSKYSPNRENSDEGLIPQQTETTSTTVAFVCKNTPETQHSDDVLDVVNAVLGSGLQSPLQERLREQLQLVYASASASYRFTPCKSIFCTLAICAPNNTEIIKQEIKQLLNAVDTWFTEDRFNTIVSEWIITRKVREQSPHSYYGAVKQFVLPDDVEGVRRLTLESARAIFKGMYRDFDVHTMESFAAQRQD